MVTIRRSLVLPVLVLVWGGCAPPAAAIDMETQSVCNQEEQDACVSFQSGAGPLTVRSIRFDMAGPGKAFVNFHGSLTCGQGSGTDRLISMVSGITKDEATVPALTDPGSLRLQFWLKDNPDHSIQAALQSLNLASSRIFDYASGGSKKVYFRISRLQIDQFASCRVHGAVFNVITTP